MLRGNHATRLVTFSAGVIEDKVFDKKRFTEQRKRNYIRVEIMDSGGGQLATNGSIMSGMTEDLSSPVNCMIFFNRKQ